MWANVAGLLNPIRGHGAMSSSIETNCLQRAEVEFQMIVNCSVGAENQTRVLC